MATTPKRLFIPNKTMSDPNQPGYGTDMRTIENFNPINTIVAGTGVTLNPTDGTGPQVEISATGGGGAPGIMTIVTTADLTSLFPLFMGTSDPLTGETFLPLFSNSSGSPQSYTFGAFWIVATSGSASIDLLPTFTAPTFTGPDLSLEWVLNAVGWSLANSGNVFSNAVTLASGATDQYPTTDYGPPTLSADLTFVNGTGPSGNGLVSAGGEPVYIAGISGKVVVQTGTAFT